MTITAPASFSKIRTELGIPSGTPLSMNDPACRTLAGKPTGAISLSDFVGKSAVTVTINGYMSPLTINQNTSRDRGTFTASVSSGTITAYSWTVNDPLGQINPTATTSSFTVTGPAYNTDSFTMQSDFTIFCTVTVNGQNHTGTLVQSYTYSELV